MACPDLKLEFLSGGKRTNIERYVGMDDWWVGYGKDESCQFEGPWEHMVALAHKILAVEAQRTVHSLDGGDDVQ